METESGVGAKAPAEAISLDMMDVAANDQVDAFEGFCQVCSKDLWHLNAQRQTQHINRCLDGVGVCYKIFKQVYYAVDVEEIFFSSEFL